MEYVIQHLFCGEATNMITKASASAGWNARVNKVLQSLRPAKPAHMTFDLKTARISLDLAVAEYTRRDRVEVTPAARVVHYREIAKTAHRLHALIDKAKASRGLSGEHEFDLLEAWGKRYKVAFKVDPEDRNDPEFDERMAYEAARDDEFGRAMAAIAAIEGAALDVAEWSHRGPGAPRDMATRRFILSLAGVYQRATGRKPTTTKDGPFHHFACEVFEAIGEDRPVTTVLNNIRVAFRAAKAERDPATASKR
jgi:hypothetical protein